MFPCFDCCFRFVDSKMEPHRSGPLKQKNKRHKGEKKRQRKDSFGSIHSARSSSSNSSRKGSSISRTVRKNQMIQFRKAKSEELLNARRRILETPILISVLNLGNSNDHLLELLHKFDPSASIVTSERGGFHVEFQKFNSNYQIVLLNKQDLFGSLDWAKITDLLLVVHSNNVDDLNPSSDNFAILNAIYYHCLPQTIHAITGMNEISNPKQKDRIKKTILELIEKSYKGSMTGACKLRTLDTAQDLQQLFHYCSSAKRKPNSYCSRRSQLLAESFNFVTNCNDSSIGTLIVDGYVRNNPFNVNSLVYIPEFGEFQLELLETVKSPYSNLRNSQKVSFSQKAEENARPDLVKENKVETIFEQEMQSMEEEMKLADVLEKKKVPKGTSDYQAAWIIDSDQEDDEEHESENDDDDNQMVVDSDGKRRVHFAPVDESLDVFTEDKDDLEEMEEVDGEKENQSKYDDEMNLDEEMETLEKFKEQRLYEMFPDEIDTPIDRPARERFIKYRGLKSFRTSTWDSNENLPPDYSRIFQFENFNRTRRRIFKTEPIGADPGYYIRVHVINVPAKLVEYYGSRPNKPLILYELLAHEHKMSVQNLVIKKLSTFTEPIRSKEQLIFHIGCRRFAARPIFSAHTIGDKHKFEKFLRTDIACVATIYAPITFPPASVLVYKQFPDGSQHLVATGSLLDCSPNRLVIKRLVLSGHPFKINRKHAVVRYMFFNREDILWFRPVELSTKYGRRGHILEPLGTHGHMKCVFDHQLTSQDTVLMTLYKRVFPKWHYEAGAIQEPTITLQTISVNDNSMAIDR